jgi:hypothetical protein
MDDALIKSSYSSVEEYPNFAYNCITHLINDENAEIIWKLLYYNDREAWRNDASHPNLTLAQKRNLVYAGQENQEDFRVFLDFGMDDAWTTEACLLRISPLSLFPAARMIVSASIAFEAYCHFKLNTHSNHQTRIDVITQTILKSLNGADVGGIGVLYFDARASRVCSSTLVGQIPYRGRRTIMCNWVA